LITYKEVVRYVVNINQILPTKAKNEDRYNVDERYSLMSVTKLWSGMLEALSVKFPEVNHGNGRPSIAQYIGVVAEPNARMRKLLLNSDNTLYLAMGRDGNVCCVLAQNNIQVG